MVKLPFDFIMGLKSWIHHLKHIMAWNWDKKLSIQQFLLSILCCGIISWTTTHLFQWFFFHCVYFKSYIVSPHYQLVYYLLHPCNMSKWEKSWFIIWKVILSFFPFRECWGCYYKLWMLWITWCWVLKYVDEFFYVSCHRNINKPLAIIPLHYNSKKTMSWPISWNCIFF